MQKVFSAKQLFHFRFGKKLVNTKVAYVFSIFSGLELLVKHIFRKSAIAFSLWK